MNLNLKAKELRRTVLGMCHEAGEGHLASSFSCMEILVSLYHDNVMLLGEDVFVMSKGHASMALYAILSELGYFSDEWIKRFCKKDGILGIHVDSRVPGIFISTGSLGHGFGVAAGMAWVKKQKGDDGKVYVLLGDGECCEGSIWETAMFVVHHNLTNLITIVDRNYISATDYIYNTPLGKYESLNDKFSGFGFGVKDILGHNIDDLSKALRSCSKDYPTVIIANTVKGRGVSFMEDDPKWHVKKLTEKEYKKAMKELS